MSVFGAPGEGIHITPLMGADGQLQGLHFGTTSADLAEQGRQAREDARKARIERTESIAKSRSLWRQTQAARVSEAGGALKNAAIRAEQAPRYAACKSLPSERIAEALKERQMEEAKPKSPSRMSRLLGREAMSAAPSDIAQETGEAPSPYGGR